MQPEETALGASCNPTAVVEVIEVEGIGWLVRARYLDGLPHNFGTLPTQEAANAFASDLHDLTAEIMKRVTGAPADFRLVEVQNGPS